MNNPWQLIAKFGSSANSAFSILKHSEEMRDALTAHFMMPIDPSTPMEDD